MVDWTALADRVQKSVMRSGLGEPVTYTPTGLAAVELRGVFDSAHEDVNLQGGVAVSTTVPRLGVRGADLPRAPRRGDAVVVRGRGYRVAQPHPDGSGGFDLDLEETS